MKIFKKTLYKIYFFGPLILFLALCSAAYGEDKDVPDYNSEYIKKYDDKLIVRTFLSSQKFEFDISSDNSGSKKIEYKPYVLLNAGAGVYYSPWNLHQVCRASSYQGHVDIRVFKESF